MSARGMAGALTGLISAAFVGVLLVIAARSDQTGVDWLVFFGLALPLALFGLLYDRLVVGGLLRWGRYTGILYWGLAFPAAKLIHLLMVQGRVLSSPPAGGSGGVAVFPTVLDLFGFLLYQGMFGLAYGAGFMMLYRQVARSFGVRRRSV